MLFLQILQPAQKGEKETAFFPANGRYDNCRKIAGGTIDKYGEREYNRCKVKRFTVSDVPLFSAAPILNHREDVKWERTWKYLCCLISMEIC